MKAIVLAGGFPQIALIEELKKRSYTVILIDYLPDPVARRHAEIFYQESTYNIEKVREIAKKEEVEFLITVCTDQALLTVAHVSEHLDLPCYIDSSIGHNVTNKKFMKEKFVAGDIPTAKHSIVKDINNLSLDCLTYPLVVKPVDCNSSRGVKKVINESQLIVALKDAIKFSRTNTAIVEDFVSGNEASVDLYVENGIAKILAITQHGITKSKDAFLVYKYDYPLELSQKIHDRIADVAQKIVDEFNLKNCPMLIQLIYNEEDISIIEFSARTGGGIKYRMIEDVTGVNVINTVIDLTEGKIPHIEPQFKDIKLTNEFLYCNNGVFNHIEGFDELVSEGILHAYYVFTNKGQRFVKAADSGDRIAGITIIGSTFEEIQQKHAIATQRMRIVDENGIDILKRELLY